MTEEPNRMLSADACMVIGPDGTPCSHNDYHPGLHSWDHRDVGQAPEHKPMTAQQVEKATRTRLRVPTDEEFEERDFLEVPALANLGQELIDSCEEFGHLQGSTVLFLWKRKGGQSGGKLTLGKCQKPSGLLAFYAQADFIVWLAADNCRDTDMDAHQLEALLFHEIMHADVVETDGGNPKPAIRGHEIEEFSAVLQRYGMWQPHTREFVKTVKQLKLDLEVSSNG